MKTAKEILEALYFGERPTTDVALAAMKEIASLAFDAGETYYRDDWPNKELFLKQLFPE